MSRFIKWMIVKASRDTASGNFIPEIDGLRFIAIFSVIFFHVTVYLAKKTGTTVGQDPLSSLLSYGDIGVQLFFVISGFVIALPFAKAHLVGSPPPKLAQYYFRRLTRLEPPYIINLLIFFMLIPLVTELDIRDLLAHLLASMGYIHNIIYGKMSLINCVAWSLEIELQFYVVAPLLTTVFAVRSKISRRLTMLGLISLFSLLSYCYNANPRFNLSILSQAQYFLTGFLLIDFYVSDWKQSPVKSLRWDMLSRAAWLILVLLLYQGEEGRLILVVPVFFAYIGAFKGVWSNRLFCQPFLYIIGGMCYTLYLYHFQIISTFGRFFIKTGVFQIIPFWAGIVLLSMALIPIILSIGAILFIFIEKPCMKRDWYVSLLDRFRSSASIKNLSESTE